MARCKSCSEQIDFVRSAKLKPNGEASWIPVDPFVKVIDPTDTDADRSILVVTSSGEVIRGVPCNPDAAGVVVGRQAHFDTCPHADKHRKRKRSQKKPQSKQQRLF